MTEQKSANSKNIEFLSKADWLDLKKPLSFGYGNVEKNVFAEYPTNISNLDSLAHTVLKNFLIGRNSYLLSGMLSPNTIIGRYCSLSRNVNIGPTNHKMHYLSTGILTKDMSELPDNEPDDKDYTIVGCDVWIGINSTVLAGKHIGHGAVIGAHSLVTKDIPPYAIAVGAPAQVIKYRFSEDIIKELLRLEWWKSEPEVICDLPFKNVERCIESIKRLSPSK